jgi:hypothetical protein
MTNNTGPAGLSSYPPTREQVLALIQNGESK